MTQAIATMQLPELEKALKFYREGTPEYAAIYSRIEEERGKHFRGAVARGRSSSRMPEQSIGKWLASETPLPTNPFENPVAVAAMPDREGRRPGPGMGAARAPEVEPESSAGSGAAGQPPSQTAPATSGDTAAPPAAAPRPSLLANVPDTNLNWALPKELMSAQGTQVDANLPEIVKPNLPAVEKADLKELEAQAKTDPYKSLLQVGLGLMAAKPGASFAQALGEAGQTGMSDWEKQRARAAEARKQIAETRRAERGEERQNAQMDLQAQNAIIERAKSIATIKSGNADRDNQARQLALGAARLAQEGRIAEATRLMDRARLSIAEGQLELEGRKVGIAADQLEHEKSLKVPAEKTLEAVDKLRKEGKHDQADLLIQLRNPSAFNALLTAGQRDIASLRGHYDKLLALAGNPIAVDALGGGPALQRMLSELKQSIETAEGKTRLPSSGAAPAPVKRYDPATGKVN